VLSIVFCIQLVYRPGAAFGAFGAFHYTHRVDWHRTIHVLHLHVYICIFMYVYIYMFDNVYICIYIYEFIDMYECMFVCGCVYIAICNRIGAFHYMYRVDWHGA